MNASTLSGAKKIIAALVRLRGRKQPLVNGRIVADVPIYWMVDDDLQMEKTSEGSLRISVPAPSPDERSER